MNFPQPVIYGIGNPLIDLVISVTDEDLSNLKIEKGVMQLVDEKHQKEILSYFKDITAISHPGGSAPNTMVACSGLGVPSLIAGKVGKDHFGDTYIKQAEKYGVISGLVQGDGVTGSSIILVTPDGERSMNTHLGMCREFSEHDIDVNKLSNSNFFYFTGYMWDTNSQKTAIKKAIQIAHEKNVKIIFDIADPFAVERNKEAFLSMINADVDVVFANQAELSILFGTEDYHSAADQLGAIVDIAGIKLGKDGSLVIDKGVKSKLPPRPILATDSTGAGDMYAAGFLASLSKGHSPKKAGKIGGYLAEEIIQGFGAQFELEQIQELRSKVLNN